MSEGGCARGEARGPAAPAVRPTGRSHLARRAVRVGDLRLLDLRLLDELVREGHLGRAAAGHEARVEVDCADHVHGVAEVALHLVEHVLARAT